MLYTKDADPRAVEFYKMMLTNNAGGKILSIELVALTPEDKARLAKMPSPDGKPMHMNLPVIMKLVVKSEKKDENGSITSNNEVFVAESAGKIVIPVPAT